MSENIIPLEKSTIEFIFKQAFKTMVDQIVVCVVNTVIFGFVCVILCVTIIGILAIPAVVGGYTESMIRAARGEKVEIGDFFKIGFNKFGTLLGAGILIFLGVAIGLICFVLPGIYLMIRWFFVTQLIVDKNAGISEAFQQSGKMVSSIFWEVLAVFILITVIEAMGGAIWIGLLITIPYVALVSAHYYLGLFLEEKDQVEDDE